MKFERRLASGLLGAAGVLIVHEFAYAVHAVAQATTSSPVRHGYLDLLWTIVGPLAGLAVGRIGVQRVRALGPVGVSTPALAGLILVGFLALEFGERLLVGGTLQSALSASVIWIGVALVAPLALLLQRAIAITAEVIRRAMEETSPPRIFGPTQRRLHPSRPTVVDAIDLLTHSVHRRGPPVRS